MSTPQAAAQRREGVATRQQQQQQQQWCGVSPNGFGSWVQIDTSGQAPNARSGHDVAVVDGKAYLFGGCGEDGRTKSSDVACLNDVHCFDLERHTWQLVPARGTEPTPRASFAMSAGPRAGTFIVAGGTGVEVDSLRSDVVEFDVDSRTWTSLVTDSEQTPCKLYGQSLCTFGDSLLLFGGSTGLHYTNDLFEYNTRTMRWRKLAPQGPAPTPRYKHQALVAGHHMYVIGGGCFKPEQNSIDVHRLNLHTLTWDVVATRGDVPKSRVAHTCSYDAPTDTIFLWGGFTSDLSRLQDFYALHLETATWRNMSPAPVKLTRAPASSAPAATIAPHLGAADAADAATQAAPTPPARAFHAAVFHQGALYVFSGANGDVRYADVWRYQLRETAPTLGTLAARALRAACGGCGDRSEWDVVARVLPVELSQAVVALNRHAVSLP